MEATPLAVLPMTSGYEKYPFSLSFLLQCYCRCLSRDGHLTLSNADPVQLLKILVLFYEQFKGVQLKSLVKNFVQIEMTTAARLPSDLECIMEEAVSSEVASEDALEDCVSKIEQYRMLFGAGAPSGHNRDLHGITKFVEQTQRDAKPIEVVPHKDGAKHVMFKEDPSPTHSSKKVLHHEIATFPDKIATRKFEANNDIRELVSKHVKFDETPTPHSTDH